MHALMPKSAKNIFGHSILLSGTPVAVTDNIIDSE